MGDIADWRDRIDKVDSKMLELLNERARCACEIGNIKAQNSMDVYNPAREREIMSKLSELNEGPLSDNSIQAIYEKIIEECRTLEKSENECD
ncbi:chorismate mutase [Candidatus Latescibacterota bacterium]